MGGSPAAALVLGDDGNFYGTTEFDGATDSGTVFKITPAGVAKRLVEFTGLVGSFGTFPSGHPSFGQRWKLLWNN